MQEAGAGVSTVTTPGERHRTAPSTTALHMLATCDPPLPHRVTSLVTRLVNRHTASNELVTRY